MNDAEHILMIVIIGVVIILVNIWRASIKRRLPDEKKQQNKGKRVDMEEKIDDDLIANPAFSFLKFNIFHKNRNDDDD
jgi:hypothetical protein